MLLGGCSSDLVSQVADSVQGESETLLIDNGTVTDDFGSYQRTRVDPTSIEITSDKSGLPDADAEAAKNFAIDFVATEVLDSIALDNFALLEKWYAEVAPKYIHGSYIEDVIAASNEGLSMSNWETSLGLIVTDAPNELGEYFMPRLLRDGKPRIAQKTFGETVELTRGPVIDSVDVRLTGGAMYFSEEEEIVDRMLKRMIANQTMIDENGQAITDMTAAREMWRGMEPELEDGLPQSGSIWLDMTYTLVKVDDGWRISGFTGSIQPDRDNRWTENASASELELRDKVK